MSQSQPVREIFALVERNRTCSQRRECARVRLLRRAQTSPANATGKTKTIEPFGIVIGDARAKNCRFPGGQRQLAAVKLFENRLQTFGAFHAMFEIGALPCEKKTIKILRRDWLNLGAQPVDSESMNSRQQPAVAPFLLRRVRVKFAAQNKAFCFKSQQRSIDLRPRQI